LSKRTASNKQDKNQRFAQVCWLVARNYIFTSLVGQEVIKRHLNDFLKLKKSKANQKQIKRGSLD
jgi:hypothetical protein